jgi:hypothetical protein
VLGISPTADQTAIRQAYARALKAIDVDRDPAAFIALRQAFDFARAHARRVRPLAGSGSYGPPATVALEKSPTFSAPVHTAPLASVSVLEAEPAQADVLPAKPPSEDAASDKPGPLLCSEPEAIPAREPAPAPAQPPAWRDDLEAIQALIFGAQTRDEIFEEARARSVRLLNGPEMADIDHATRIEQWATQVILSGIPRSNALLIPAIDRFGWLKRYEQWDCPQVVGAVIGRYQDVVYTNKLNEAQGGFGVLFRTLRAGSRPRGSQAEPMEAFLAEMTARHPTILREVPEESLRAWQALIAKRHARPVARLMRAIDARWAAGKRNVIRFLQVSRLDVVFKAIGIFLLVILGLGLVIATHGLALIPILATAGRWRK